MKTKTKKIYTRRMAQHLIDAGFPAVGQTQSTKDITRSVWIFEDTPELEAVCAEYVTANRSIGNEDKLSIDDGTLAGLFFVGGQSIKSIAKVHGVTEARVESAIKKRVDQARFMAIAALDDDGRKLYMAAQTDDERNAILSERILQGGFLVHNSAGTYHFPANDTAGEVSENA